jgi:hypothetical protein
MEVTSYAERDGGCGYVIERDGVVIGEDDGPWSSYNAETEAAAAAAAYAAGCAHADRLAAEAAQDDAIRAAEHNA